MWIHNVRSWCVLAATPTPIQRGHQDRFAEKATASATYVQCIASSVRSMSRASSAFATRKAAVADVSIVDF